MGCLPCRTLTAQDLITEFHARSDQDAIRYATAAFNNLMRRGIRDEALSVMKTATSEPALQHKIMWRNLLWCWEPDLREEPLFHQLAEIVGYQPKKTEKPEWQYFSPKEKP